MSRGRGRAGAALVLAIAALLVAGTAVAQPASGTRTRAAARFKQGQEFFKGGDYDHAIVEYEAAFQLSHEPLLIFNIALCHDRARRPADALAAFQRYLALVPVGEVADEAREDVARLTAVVDALHAQTAAAAAEAAEQARRAEAAHAAEAESAAQRDRERRDAARRDREQRASGLASRSRIERWTGISTVAVGAISLGAGVKYGLDARSAAAEITDHRGAWTDAVLARDEAGRSAQTRMIVFTSVGAAAAIGGVVLYLFGRHHDMEASRLRLELDAVSRAAAVALAGRF
jgi:tetratricopeptide (TPR) repeat protein